MQGVGVVCALIGCIIMSLDFDNDQNNKKRSRSIVIHSSGNNNEYKVLNSNEQAIFNFIPSSEYKHIQRYLFEFNQYPK